ncbi:MAG: phosphorylase, partial [Bacteroidales bacterium]
EAFVKQTGWSDKLPYPYCVDANRDLLRRIGYDMVQGITGSAPGFFGPQGRAVRAPLMFPELNHKIENFSYEGKHFTNMEMECSALYGLSKILGHNALTVCLIIANRVTTAATTNYKGRMDKLIDTVLERIF